MNAFMLTIFWLLVLDVIIGAFHTAADHPRFREPINSGVDVVSLIFNLALLAWSAYLIWGR